MSQTLRDALLKSGAVIDGASGLPLHFGAPRAELHSALNVCSLATRSTLAVLLGDGPDLADLLNRLSTKALTELESGAGADTVLTTSKGRIVERLFVAHLGEPGLLLVGGIGRAGAVLEHIAKYTFAERTGLRDLGESFRLLALGGPLAAEALSTAGFEAPPPLGCIGGTQDGVSVFVLGHDGSSPDGYSILVPGDQAGSLWRQLVLAVSKTDGRPVGELALEVARVRHGIPAAGAELTVDYNPLEAGLRSAVSFDKGCYVGQEVVARLDTYDKVSRRLVGMVIPDDVLVVAGETALFRNNKKAGVITSVAGLEGAETVALGYVKTRVAAAGNTVQLGSADGHTVILHDFPIAP